MRTPFIISWPKGIAAHGDIRTQFHHVDDIAPTLLELTGITPPKQYNHHAIKPMEGTSFAYSLSNGKAPARKTEQYYELEANRAYYADGWKIVTYREGRQAYDEPAWELYNLADDFSESHDVAAQHPDKVSALEKKWWAAAEQYQVLPLVDAGLLERALYSKFIKQPPPDERSIPTGGGTIPHNIAPILPGKSYIISADITRQTEQQQGVIVAQGDQFSGYTLYVQDNHLVYERNTGADTLRLVASEPLPTGHVQIQARFEKVSTALTVAKGLFSEGWNFNRLSVLKGTLSLWQNGQSVGEMFIEQPFLVGWEGLDVGRDTGSPVSPHYQPPFAFSGNLQSVDYQLR